MRSYFDIGIVAAVVLMGLVFLSLGVESLVYPSVEQCREVLSRQAILDNSLPAGD